MGGDVLEKIVMLLIGGVSIEKALNYCLTHFGMSVKEGEEAVAEARKKLTLAADFVRDEQLGTAIARLNNLYTKAMAADDIKTALQAQRELNKLMNLYKAVDDSLDEGDSRELLERIKIIERYILPLRLIDVEYPIEEHVRVAAEIIREWNRCQGVSGEQGKSEAAE